MDALPLWMEAIVSRGAFSDGFSTSPDAAFVPAEAYILPGASCAFATKLIIPAANAAATATFIMYVLFSLPVSKCFSASISRDLPIGNLTFFGG
ncbi:MAG: hypothetical protein M9939_18605 [Mesorhizobium sp.]|nr:hypothetical protein [Mesorhizobium sp.]MCO5163150.1 hypothetical protein [Mesorhizobium sp.]